MLFYTSLLDFGRALSRPFFWPFSRALPELTPELVAERPTCFAEGFDTSI